MALSTSCGSLESGQFYRLCRGLAYATRLVSESDQFDRLCVRESGHFERQRVESCLFKREEKELANLVERLDKATTAYGMEISAKVNGQKLETVTSFQYLGLVMTDEGPG